MGVRRTAVVKLTVSDEQRDATPPNRFAEQYLYDADRTATVTVGPTPLRTEFGDQQGPVNRDALYSKLREETSVPTGPGFLFKPPSNAFATLKLSKRVSNENEMDSGSNNRRSPPKRWTTTRAARPSTGTRCRWQLLRDESNRRSFSRQKRPTPVRAVRTRGGRTTNVPRDDGVAGEQTHPLTRSISTFRMRRTGAVTMRFPEDTGHPDQTVLDGDLGVREPPVSSTGTFWQGRDAAEHWCRGLLERSGTLQSPWDASRSSTQSSASPREA